MTETLKRVSDMTAREFNAAFPVGTPVTYWRGLRGPNEPHALSKTRTPAWTLGSGVVVVSVEGSTGGMALTHVKVEGYIATADGGE